VVVLAQEKTPITVKDTSVATGVIILSVDLNGKSVDLQSTGSMPARTQLKTGRYMLVHLPRNHGLYDCQNVDVYPTICGTPPRPSASGSIAPFRNKGCRSKKRSPRPALVLPFRARFPASATKCA